MRSPGACGYDPGVLLSPEALVPSESELLVVCLCAEWCGVCREYRARFEEVQGRLAGVEWRVGFDEMPILRLHSRKPHIRERGLEFFKTKRR